MIFRDKDAPMDREAFPYPRGQGLESCVNCGAAAKDHFGWLCPTAYRALAPAGWADVVTFSQNYGRLFFYMTGKMFNSLPPGFLSSLIYPRGIAPAPPPPAVPASAAGIVIGRATLGPVEFEMPAGRLPVQEERHDSTDWKTWARLSLREGDCACGIPRAGCTYHGGGK